jgi:mannose/cellobiose epimerase-like protein (N-acyl-D-glucosamine 2-epimerase family)
MLGRGAEALALHLEILDDLDFSEAEKSEARSLFNPAIRNICAAIRGIAEKNNGRIPFKVGRDFRAVGATVDPAATAPADLFCGKGLLVSAENSDRHAGLTMLQTVADRISSGLIEPSPDPAYSGKLSQAVRMLFLSVPRLLLKEHFPAAQKEALRDVACDYIEFVMDRHFDKKTKRFSEWIDPGTGERGHLLDPGHCAEFVGLALSAIRSMEPGGAEISDRRSRVFQSAKAMLPQILFSAFESGFNPRLGGMHKAVDNRNGKLIDASMPWWNLPETMRAAILAAKSSQEEEIRDQCLRIFAECHNAYFSHYLNKENLLFPFQTRSGETGGVLDAAPAVPEGDPLYHTNLCILEIVSTLRSNSFASVDPLSTKHL